MIKKSFHRAILPWVFVIAFFAIAPAVVFYTAGYRWNSKKGAIERNGTLIIDTRPNNATIKLNGEVFDDRSPSTMQNLAPGTYEIRLELNGYHPWQKTLEIRPELVTFVNDVQFWMDAEPQRIVEGDVQDVVASPNGRFLAYTTFEDSSFAFSFLELSSNAEETFSFNTSSIALPMRIRWSDDSSSVYLRSGDGMSWIVRRGGGQGIIELPEGTYRWDDGILVGSTGGERYLYDVANNVIDREDFPYHVLDMDGTYSIVSSTGTTRLSLTDQSKPDRRYELPNGDWRFGPTYNGLIFLVADGEWLGFDPDLAEPTALTIPVSKDPLYMKISGNELLLSNDEGEIWLTALERSEPELVVRKSKEIQTVLWFRRGNNIFFNTDTQVIALNLDSRDGRMETVLAEFDDIQGMTLANRIIYISGKKGEEQGIFSLQVE